jgi:pyruvate/2-oxoglutarate dehydrogenase complex dihydrolipoamide acyltransferase (E2) component
MAIVEVKVPQLSESVAEATMLQWKKKVGDSVTADEILIDIETDKVVLEVPAPSSGVLVEIVVADGGTVAAEQLIARIDTEATAGAAAPAASAAAATPAAAPAHTCAPWPPPTRSRPPGSARSVHAQTCRHSGGRTAPLEGKTDDHPTNEHPEPARPPSD